MQTCHFCRHRVCICRRFECNLQMRGSGQCTPAEKPRSDPRSLAPTREASRRPEKPMEKPSPRDLPRSPRDLPRSRTISCDLMRSPLQSPMRSPEISYDLPLSPDISRYLHLSPGRDRVPNLRKSTAISCDLLSPRSIPKKSSPTKNPKVSKKGNKNPSPPSSRHRSTRNDITKR